MKIIIITPINAGENTNSRINIIEKGNNTIIGEPAHTTMVNVSLKNILPLTANANNLIMADSTNTIIIKNTVKINRRSSGDQIIINKAS